MNTKLIVFYEISDFCRFIDNFEGELIITMNDACHNGELVATWNSNPIFKPLNFKEAIEAMAIFNYTLMGVVDITYPLIAKKYPHRNRYGYKMRKNGHIINQKIKDHEIKRIRQKNSRRINHKSRWNYQNENPIPR